LSPQAGAVATLFATPGVACAAGPGAAGAGGAGAAVAVAAGSPEVAAAADEGVGEESGAGTADGAAAGTSGVGSALEHAAKTASESARTKPTERVMCADDSNLRNRVATSSAEAARERTVQRELDPQLRLGLDSAPRRSPTLMARTLTTISALLFVLLASKGAYAQKAAFGEKGEFIIGADRLVPVFSYTQEWAGTPGFPPPNTTSLSTTSSQGAFSFLWGSGGPIQAPAFFTAPRAGFDYVLIPHLTLGAELVIFATTGASQTLTRNTTMGSTATAQAAPEQVIFGFAPRVGYVLRLTDMFSLWLRGGFSFYSEGDSASLGNTGTGGANLFALDLEPQFVITPLAHVGIALSPTLDLPLFGQVWNNINQSANFDMLYFGLNASLLVYF
jgi:hypothetical protein